MSAKQKRKLARTARELADLCGMSLTTAYRLIRGGKLPAGSKGPWDPTAVTAYRKKNQRTKNRSASKKGVRARQTRQTKRRETQPTTTEEAVSDPIDQVEIRIKTAKAEQLEFNLTRSRDEVVPRSELEPQRLQRVMEIKKALMNIGKQTGIRYGMDQEHAREVRAFVDRKILDCLDQFARPLPIEDQDAE